MNRRQFPTTMKLGERRWAVRNGRRLTRRALALAGVMLGAVGCSDDAAVVAPTGGGAGGGATNRDGDCMADADERAVGTDPGNVDTDGDGFDDCAELACVSDPTAATQRCYTCGWKHNDPGDLTATGAGEGDVIGNMQLVDQCLESVSLWDFATRPRSPAPEEPAYRILVMSAVW